MPRSTRKKRSTLRGGAVSYLNETEMEITNGRQLREKVELLTIDAHGSTTRDNKFMIVPEKTYMFFTSRSGLPAKGNTPSQDVYLSHRNEANRNSYYDRLHTQLFRPYEERVATGRSQYPKNLYVYEPGDIIPDYLLSFNNTVIFMFKHGVYRLPVKSIQGSEGLGSYIGRPMYFIKKMLMEGHITESELDELDVGDKRKILEMDLAALKDGPTTDTKNFKQTALWAKLENLCCRAGDDNLLFQPPFPVDRFRENGYAMRLSTLLRYLPVDESKPYRFFFMLFCRVSYEDVASGITSRELEVPRLLRTLSVSGKCSFSTRDTAFNLLRIRDIFCGIPAGFKNIMLEDDKMKDLLRILKKATYPPGGDMSWWRRCLDGSYNDFNTVQRVFLAENYKGYLDIENMRTLVGLFDYFKKTIRDYSEKLRELSNKPPRPRTQEGIQNIRMMIEIYKKLGTPFKTLNDQLERQTQLMDAYIARKKALVREIYSLIHQPYRNRNIVIPVGDYLFLVSSTIEDLEEILGRLKTGTIIADLKENAANMTSNIAANDLQDYLEHRFMGWSGSQLVSRSVEPFEIEEIPDTSIVYENSNNENGNGNGNGNGTGNGSGVENGNEARVVHNEAELGVGGRRRTRKKFRKSK